MENKNNSRIYIVAGSLFMAIGLMVNPFVLQLARGGAFSTSVLVVLLMSSLLMIVSGIVLIRKKNGFMSWAGEKYHDMAVIVFNMIVLFLVINAVAAFFVKKPQDIKADTSYFYAPQDLLIDSIGFLRNIYPGKSDEDIKELLLLTSPYANHPVLEYMERVQESKHYNVGYEGVRFDQEVTPRNVREKINGAVWVFGGSTTFGQGVSDNETITAFLNKIDSSGTYINFGVHAYHQSNEIDKMLLLLRKGYLPSAVVFIDGLNDLIRMVETNFHPLETPALAKSAYTSDYNIATRVKETSFLRKLPVVKLLWSVLNENDENNVATEVSWTRYDNVYDAENLYNKDPKSHFAQMLLRSPYNEVDSAGLNYMVWKLDEMYKANNQFLKKISQAYGFKAFVFYQPLGVLSDNNPFWKNQAARTETPLFRNFNAVAPVIQSYVREGRYDLFYDISDVQRTCPDCYVDLTHYNPQLNKLIADSIYQELQNK